MQLRQLIWTTPFLATSFANKGNPDYLRKNGKSALHLAAEKGHLFNVMRLLEEGYTCRKKSNQGGQHIYRSFGLGRTGKRYTMDALGWAALGSKKPLNDRVKKAMQPRYVEVIYHLLQNGCEITSVAKVYEYGSDYATKRSVLYLAAIGYNWSAFQFLFNEFLEEDKLKFLQATETTLHERNLKLVRMWKPKIFETLVTKAEQKNVQMTCKIENAIEDRYLYGKSVKCKEDALSVTWTGSYGKACLVDAGIDCGKKFADSQLQGHFTYVDAAGNKITSLMRALFENNFTEVKEFLQSANPTPVIEDYVNAKMGPFTPLHIAAMRKEFKIVELLAKLGAVDSSKDHKTSAIFMAMSEGQLELVKVLLKASGDAKATLDKKIDLGGSALTVFQIAQIFSKPKYGPEMKKIFDYMEQVKQGNLVADQ